MQRGLSAIAELLVNW